MKCSELAFVLRCLSKYGRVATFEWIWESGWLEDDEVPAAVWEALQLNASSLQKLDISLSKTDGANWVRLALSLSPQRTLNHSSDRVNSRLMHTDV